MITLRPYQERGLSEIRSALRDHQAVLYVCGCGSGKGTLVTFIVNGCVQRGKRVIFAVHGKTLVHDMSQRVRRLGIEHGVLMGSHKRERWHPVQVASIDTLHRMAHPPQADMIIADEADTAMSPTWLKAISQYPNSKIIGLTATPIRHDKRPLGRKSGGIFDMMILGPSEEELINLGFLVGSRVLAPPAPEGLNNLKKVAGEFDSKQQAAICDKAKVIGDIVGHWKKHASQRKTAAYGVDQAHANHIAEKFREAGVNWAYVDADTPQDERDRIWADLKKEDGTLMGVASVGCLAVGWDVPIISCLIAARRTASLRLWRQILGRGSRTYSGKTDFLVLDHVGNTYLHEPFGMFEDCVPWSLDGEAIKRSDADKAPALTTCKTPVKKEDGTLQFPCYATFKTGPSHCPYCGLLLLRQARDVKEEAGELREIKRDELSREALTGTPPAGFRHNAGHRAAFEDLKRQCIERGWKPKAIAVKFRLRFGVHISSDWWREIKEMERQQAAAQPQESMFA